MKIIKLINLFFIVSTSLLLVQCTTDPIPGPSGEDGIDGVDGADGATGTTECAACHNIATSEAVHASYMFSGHAEGNAVGYAGNRAGCADCHSNEGHIDYLTYGTSSDYNGAATPISCTTCHDKHMTFDFINEGYDYALRSLAGVTLRTDESYTINYSGTSNNCALCHQPRRSPPVDDGTGNGEIYSHYGPHHSPQSTFLEGIQGAEIAGSVEYPAPQSAAHRAGSTCTSCHMGETSGETDGNHTWIQTPNACTQCHSSGIPPNVGGLQEDMETLLALLLDKGVFEIDDDGHPHYVEGTFPIDHVHAAWNYILIEEDASKGVHNPGYARALVKNSIEALSAN